MTAGLSYEIVYYGTADEVSSTKVFVEAMNADGSTGFVQTSARVEVR